MLSSSQIERFFDHIYLWKEPINILNFLHGHSHYKNVVAEIITFGWVWSGVPIPSKHALT